MSDSSNPLSALTAKIVGAYSGKNSVPHGDLPRLIHSVHQALKQSVEPEAAAVAENLKRTAAQIRKSITSDALISFIDGKPYKMLKRHLTTRGLTVGDYKAKYGLPRDYPVTAPSYSAMRSALAKTVGLGQHRQKAAVAKAKAAAPARRGRAKSSATEPS